MQIHYFQRYHSKENVDTSNTKYIQMAKKMIELLINGYEHYENERKSKDDENN